MQWLEQLPFADNRVIQIGFLVACGVAALVVLAILYRLAFAHRLRVPGGRTRQPRLGLVDAFSLDGQRQLVLVRRDNVEHLVMIGGPNDVLVESQINRALTPARENNQASPLLAPGGSGRRTETPLAAAPVVAEAPPPAPAKVAAPPAAPAPTAPKAPPPAPTPAAPKAPAPAAASAAPKAPAPAPLPAAPVAPAPATLPAAPNAPAPATVNAPTAPSAPAPMAKPIEPEPPARPAPPQGAQTPEPDRPPPPSSARPAPARPGMPPPIVPAAGAASRATVARLTEKVPPRQSPVSGNSAVPPPAPARPEKAEAAVEPRATPLAANLAPASPGFGQVRPAAKTVPPEGGQKPGDTRPAAEKPGQSNVKPAKVDDPFADLDTLEAEMARLLGREK
jgi:flagellar protein FliO/FliZ